MEQEVAETGWCRTSVGLSYAHALALVALALPVCGLWLHFAGLRLLPGPARLAAAAPVVVLNQLLSKLFCGGLNGWRDIDTLVLVSFNVGWLASFKVCAGLCLELWTVDELASSCGLAACGKLPAVGAPAAAYLPMRAACPSYPTTHALPPFHTASSSPQAISWAVNRGALCTQRFTPAQFVAVFTLPITPKVPLADASPAPSGPGSVSVTPAGAAMRSSSGSGSSLASSFTSGGGHMRKRASGGRLADDAGGPHRMARNWAGKQVILAAVLAALHFQLPGLLESLVYGERVLGMWRGRFLARVGSGRVPGANQALCTAVAEGPTRSAHSTYPCMQAWGCLCCCH